MKEHSRAEPEQRLCTQNIPLCITQGKERRDGPKPDGSFLDHSINLHNPYNILVNSIREQKSLKALLMSSEMKNSFCPQNRSSLLYKYLHSQIFNNQKVFKNQPGGNSVCATLQEDEVFIHSSPVFFRHLSVLLQRDTQ